MDSVAEIAAAAQYVRVRYAHLSADIFKDKSGDGRILVTVDIGLRQPKLEHRKEGELRVVSEIKVALHGIPKDTPAGEDEIKSAAFKLEVHITANIVLPRVAEDKVQSSGELAVLLARPLYMTAATELRALGAKFGYNGLNFTYDLTKAVADGKDAGSQLENSTPTVSKPAAKRVALKPRKAS